MICVDASVAAKWLFPEALSAQALALARNAETQRERMIAPALLPLEITNVIWQRARRGVLSAKEAKDELNRFFAFGVSTTSARVLHERALSVAAQLAIPSAYDAHYVALAQLADATLWTDDGRLLRLLAGRLSYVRWIGDYPV